MLFSAHGGPALWARGRRGAGRAGQTSRGRREKPALPAICSTPATMSAVLMYQFQML